MGSGGGHPFVKGAGMGVQGGTVMCNSGLSEMGGTSYSGVARNLLTLVGVRVRTVGDPAAARRPKARSAIGLGGGEGYQVLVGVAPFPLYGGGFGAVPSWAALGFRRWGGGPATAA